MANIGHTRTRSLRIPGADSFLKRPAPAASSSSAQSRDQQHSGPSHLTLFLRNLRLLSLDVHPDWPDITAETFSTKDNQQNIKRRIQSVEWALYQLLCLWDPRDAHEKLAPFFPPLEPIQSIKLRGALYTSLDHLKKNGILGRDAVLRKTMLDECKGERLEEVLSVFSTAVLKDVVQRDGGHEAVTQQLALEKFHYTAVPTEELTVLLLAHQASLRRMLDGKQEKKKAYGDFAQLLREKDLNLAQRKEELERAIDEDESTEFIFRADMQMLQDRVIKNWYGSNEWLEAVIHGDGPTEDGGLLSQTFDKVWKNVEAGELGDVESKRRKGLVEQLDARVQEQNSRLEKWMSFGEQIKSQKKGDKKEGKKEKNLPANLDLGIGAHETLQLKSADEGENQWTPKQHNAQLLDKLNRDLTNVGKPKRVASPGKRRVPAYEEQVSRSPSPERIPSRQQPILGNNTPRKQDWAPIAQNNTPRGQDWDFNTRNGRGSVDLDGSSSPSPEAGQGHVDEDVEMKMGEAEPTQKEEEEDSYEEINHEDAMDVDDKEKLPAGEPSYYHSQEFKVPPPPSSRLRNSPALSRIENEVDYASIAPPPATSKLRASPSPYSAQSIDDYAPMAPPPAASRSRASPSPYAAQIPHAVDDHSMPPPPAPQTLRRNSPSKSQLRDRLRSSARKPTAKKPSHQVQANEAVPESPDLATKILNSMNTASPSPVKHNQPLSLAERTRQNMLSVSKPNFDPAFSKPRHTTPLDESDDESLEQFTPRPALSRGSSATTAAAIARPSTITRSTSLADKTRMTMSSLRKSAMTPGAPEPAPPEESLGDLLQFTPPEAVAPTPAQPMTLAERTQMSMRSVRPKSTVKKSRQSIANLEEYDELQLVPSPQPARNPKIRLSSVPYMEGMAEEDGPDFGMAEEAANRAEANRKSEDLIERTRQSMKDLDLVSQKAQLERKKSVKVAAKKKRESFMPQRHSVYEEEDTLKLIENAEEVPYEDAFRSRPKIAMSPNVSPAKGSWRDESVSPFPM